MALRGLEVAGSRSLSFPVWARVLRVLGPPAAIQQKVLECLGGSEACMALDAGFKRDGDPEMEKVLWAGTQAGFALNFQSGKSDLSTPVLYTLISCQE